MSDNTAKKVLLVKPVWSSDWLYVCTGYHPDNLSFVNKVIESHFDISDNFEWEITMKVIDGGVIPTDQYPTPDWYKN